MGMVRAALAEPDGMMMLIMVWIKYMIPSEFVFRKRLPKTKLGKVDFKSLEEDTRGDYDE